MPLTLLKTCRCPSGGLRRKRRNEFSAAGLPALDFISTVSEARPVEPAHGHALHWAWPTRLRGQAATKDRRRACANTFTMLKSRTGMFAALPMKRLDRLALRRQLDAIGAARTARANTPITIISIAVRAYTSSAGRTFHSNHHGTF